MMHCPLLSHETRYLLSLFHSAKLRLSSVPPKIEIKYDDCSSRNNAKCQVYFKLQLGISASVETIFALIMKSCNSVSIWMRFRTNLYENQAARH